MTFIYCEITLLGADSFLIAYPSDTFSQPQHSSFFHLRPRVVRFLRHLLPAPHRINRTSIEQLITISWLYVSASTYGSFFRYSKSFSSSSLIHLSFSLRGFYFSSFFPLPPLTKDYIGVLRRSSA